MFARFLALSSAAIIALAHPQAAVADDHTPPPSEQQASEALSSALANMFVADPLSSEQEERLPEAMKVVDSVFPAGTYRTMMDDSVKPMMGSMMGAADQLPMSMMGQMLGLSSEEVTAMGDATIGDIMEIMDPAYDQRINLSSQLSIDLMDAVVDQIEPPLRAGLTRAYAVKFTSDQLAEMNAFFATETGSYYASQSFLIFTDPQVMAAMSDMMPVMMEQIPELTRKLEADMAALPAPRMYEDLSETEKGQLAELLGMSEAELEERQSSLFVRPRASEPSE